MSRLSVYFLSLCMIFLSSCSSEEEIRGCTDSQSTNYNVAATVDDGNCSYLRDEFLGVYSTTFNCTPLADNYNLNDIVSVLIQPNDSDNTAVEVIVSDVEVETQFSQLIPMTLIFVGKVVGDELRFENVDAHRAYVQGFRISLNGTLKRNTEGTLTGKIVMKNFDEITRMETIRSFNCNYVWIKS